jgi:hypothetical protein
MPLVETGLKPRNTKWIYDMVLCPMIAYGSIAYWSRMKFVGARKELMKLEQSSVYCDLSLHQDGAHSILGDALGPVSAAPAHRSGGLLVLQEADETGTLENILRAPILGEAGS